MKRDNTERLAHYADCIQRGVHVSGTQMRTLLLELHAAQQPAAEAQAQGGGEDREPDDGKVICPSCCHQFRAIPAQVQRDMIAAGFEPPFTAPPSAPVGVDWRAMYRFQSAIRYMDDNPKLTTQQADKMADDDMAVFEAALAQQPAAVDEAMVERALAEWKRLEGHQTDAVRMSAALQEALAAQPGGSDNDH